MLIFFVIHSCEAKDKGHPVPKPSLHSQPKHLKNPTDSFLDNGGVSIHPLAIPAVVCTTNVFCVEHVSSVENPTCEHIGIGCHYEQASAYAELTCNGEYSGWDASQADSWAYAGYD
ncbi:hypothetical protein DSO57_1009810 [Entomophthora muscae]|uniref:Uncharacterized protein n=1 Tax=Entomophthora muscae TaxID=34485 RepID=A0ACC2RY16_9FUNG|nr:hypothetical protein DSO57_1009810 [Entomophthora muscae]